MAYSLLEWGAFGVFVLGMLPLDLGVFHHRDHVVRPGRAAAVAEVAEAGGL
ncbi:MAG TPA: hypothetical protein VFF02_03520 [Anaeromyxobacteraceae bacterium]|nr:hypothetical protein [Anaeromyxobacteraceae bacterium]